MKLTRELITEAVSLGRAYLPKFTATELAQVLGVGLIDALRCVKANERRFVIDAEKQIMGLSACNSIQTMSSTEVWEWYLKNRLNGKGTGCVTLSDQNRLTGTVNQRVKWERDFSLVSATFATTDKTGQEVVLRVTRDYSTALAERIVRLGTVSGSGQVPDRFLFGVVLAEGEVAERKVCGFPIYSPEWAMEEMLSEVEWVTIETVDAIKATMVPVSMQQIGPCLAPPQSDTGVVFGSLKTKEDAMDAAALAGKPSPEPEQVSGRKINRRTKEQLDAERSRMNADLLDKGANPADAVKCFNIESFTEAEKFYKAHLKELEARIVVAPTEETPPVKEPDHPGQTYLPGTHPDFDDDKIVPVVVTEKPAEKTERKSMTTIANMEVADLKADIAAKAGMGQPEAIRPATPPPMAAAVAAAPTVPASVPPVVAPPPPGASVDASDLLNSLLKATGQT